MKTDTPTKKKALRAGLTEMRREKHNYDGYLVRRGKFNHTFHRYVGAGARLSAGAKAASRFADARERASLALDTLDGILRNLASWRTADGRKRLTKKSALALRELGFKIKSPA